MQPFTSLTSIVALLPIADIDTDQIIPARYLKTTSKSGLGEGLFADWRYMEDGTPQADFVLNDPRFQNAQILLAGDNFGCGSSREHAPWALSDYGFRAILSTSFADIFGNNSLKNGLLPVEIDPASYESLQDMLLAYPEMQISIDLETQQVTLPGGKHISFQIHPFAKNCLLNGIDELGYLLSHEAQIASYEEISSHKPGGSR